MKKIDKFNPYELFGLTSKSNLKQLKKAYYNWAKLVHTDKGGNRDDFEVIHYCYEYIRNQLENCKEVKTYEQLENDFEEFCKKQILIIPPFRKIFLESSDGECFKKFHKRFEELNKKTIDGVFDNPFNEGYGIFMNKSEKIIDYKNIKQKNKIKNVFKKEIIKYQQPNLIFYGNFYNYKVKKIKDFSHILKNLECTDYVKAFSKTEIVKVDINKRAKTLKELLISRKLIFKNEKKI